MIIELKDLQKGDEILFSGYDLRYFKVLNIPQLRTKPTVWGNTNGYKSVKCLEMYDKIKGHSSYNREVYMDFNGKNIWLVKREGVC